MDLGLYRFILVLLHTLYAVYVYTRRLSVKLKIQLEDLIFGRKSLKADLELISREVAVIKKIPSHIVLIFGKESISINDIVNVTLWSQAAGISYVSFYDFKGCIKKYKRVYEDTLARAKDNKHHISKLNGHKNGFTKVAPIVRFLDITDGKGTIIQVARTLCDQASAEKLTSSDISLDYLHDLIIKESGVPEPELALYCGEICSSYGLLPWHIRVTEFLPLYSHHNLRVETFLSVLRRYGRCEQRLGT